MRKIPFAGVELTSQRVRGLRGTSELQGRPVLGIYVYIIQYTQYFSMTIIIRDCGVPFKRYANVLPGMLILLPYNTQNGTTLF